MIIHKTIPKGAVKVKYEAEFYQLKERKKVMYQNNRQLRVGLRYLIWSRYSRCWFERSVREYDDEEDYRYYVNLGWLWLYPTEENKEEIRADVAKSKMGYYALMKKRQIEADHERHLLHGNKGDGYKTRNKFYRQIRYNK